MKTVQDRFLNALRKQKIPATIIIMNGYQIKNAIIVEFDSFVIIVLAEDSQKMIFKHSISSITPAMQVDYTEAECEK